jgi:hypothetical protein
VILSFLASAQPLAQFVGDHFISAVYSICSLWVKKHLEHVR